MNEKSFVMMTDHTASPFWTIDGKLISYEQIPMSARLCEAIMSWNAAYEEAFAFHSLFDHGRHAAQGKCLADELKAQLGEEWTIFYRYEQWNGDDKDELLIHEIVM